MKIAVFCSANKNIDPDFFTMKEELGKWMGGNDHEVENGGRAIGIVPSIVEKGGKTFSDLDVEIPCDNLSDRKDLLLAQSNIMVALPGGIGTIDEIFTIAASHCIGYHKKKVILYNMKGFWNSTIALLNDIADKGMIRGDWHEEIEVANSLEELKKKIEESA